MAQRVAVRILLGGPIGVRRAVLQPIQQGKASSGGPPAARTGIAPARRQRRGSLGGRRCLRSGDGGLDQVVDLVPASGFALGTAPLLLDIGRGSKSAVKKSVKLGAIDPLVLIQVGSDTRESLHLGEERLARLRVRLIESRVDCPVHRRANTPRDRGVVADDAPGSALSGSWPMPHLVTMFVAISDAFSRSFAAPPVTSWKRIASAARPPMRATSRPRRFDSEGR